MSFQYENLSEDQFEQLAVLLCQQILGIGVQPFSKGADGGRDGLFIGTALMLPDSTNPWKGRTVIQAKHSNGYNTSFSDKAFFSDSNPACTIAIEIPKILSLLELHKLDHYLLISNRRLSAQTNDTIREYIVKKTGLAESSILLCGIEQLETWLKAFPSIPDQVNLFTPNSPLVTSPREISEVIDALTRHMDVFSDSGLSCPPTPRVPYTVKNKINRMTEIYAETQRKYYLKNTKMIYSFLSDPINKKFQEKYQTTIQEFQLLIIASRSCFDEFDGIMEKLATLLFERDEILNSHKRLTRTLLFYMYWNCDIGENGDDVKSN